MTLKSSPKTPKEKASDMTVNEKRSSWQAALELLDEPSKTAKTSICQWDTLQQVFELLAKLTVSQIEF